MTVMQGIAVAGGLTTRATERGLEIKRKNQDGQVETINAKLSDILKPDDVVNVKESWF
jgi:polysaccharide export outer membrane protein